MPTFPISLPVDPKPREVSWKQASRVAVASSPFTGQEQVYAHPGQWWEVNFELPPLYGSTAAAWAAAMLRLNGREGTFNFAPTDENRGDPGGTVTVDSIAGDTLTLSGLTGTIKGGDWLQIENGLYRATADSVTIGDTFLEVWPKPRSEVTEGVSTVNYSTPQGRFRLFDSFEWDMDVAKFYGITIGAREVV